MDERVKKLKGSPSRDLFKLWHKSGPRNLYSLDIDLALVCKNPWGIAGYVDYKTGRDTITFTEVTAYNDLISAGKRLFIVRAEFESTNDFPSPRGEIVVDEYLGGDPKPDSPTVHTREERRCKCEADYWDWESGVRALWQKVAVERIRGKPESKRTKFINTGLVDP